MVVSVEKFAEFIVVERLAPELAAEYVVVE